MFEFAWPWLFLLLPLPWLVRVFVPPLPPHDAALCIPFYTELTALQRSQSKAVPYWRSKTAAYILIWLLLLCAAARPQLQGNLQERPTTGRDLLIAVDVSSSMLYSDMTLQGSSLSRMDFVKHWLDSFLAARHGDRLGLILFGSQAYLQAPLTYDHHSVRTWVQEAQPGIAGNTTSIGDAIGLAIKRLRVRPAEHRVLILVTDGANNSGVMSPLAAAQLAARYKIKIYTVGIGSRKAESSLLVEAEPASLELDERSLKSIAKTTAGEYFHLTNSSDLVHMHNSLSQLEPASGYQPPKRSAQELYSWPLAAALLLSMIIIALRLYPTLRNSTRAEESR
ncbi:VWA domain-containing protein [Pseudomonas sp. C27(2019)]|uniref:VWA domain-containing protein n=1 Tax=Pseudomonas sp. C27(2019) TaxID=2604941 RepID=UPI001244C1B3|nr:VWA domain-containing protein [Pseudomonas sp. C27(2019)]QEY58375.1 VWA domain-containing protein [Pseudomonas sp. C27(2019)]